MATGVGNFKPFYNRYNDISPFYGSDQITNPTTGLGCTAGFAAVRNGTQVMLTAAHCQAQQSFAVFANGSANVRKWGSRISKS